MIGVGAMLAALGGNQESAGSFASAIGKIITKASLDDEGEALTLEFKDGSAIQLKDDGQSCCESRYMRTDDDLSAFVGAKLTGGEIRAAGESEEPESGDNCHDIEFLVIKTDRGDFTMTNHNEHNGYYGGFAIRASTVRGPSKKADPS